MAFKKLLDFAHQCLCELESMFGPRNSHHVLSGIEFLDTHGPRISDPTQKCISIELPKRHAHCDILQRWHIAHECVHLLDPHVDPTNVLEEGIAVWFQNNKVPNTERFRDKTGNYRRAELLVEPIAKKLHSIKSIRNTCVKIGDIDSHVLMEYTQIDHLTCKKLCERFSGCKPWWDF